MSARLRETRVIGAGFVGRRLLETLGADGQVARGTVRAPEAAAGLRARGLQVCTLDLDHDPHELSGHLVQGENLVITLPPDPRGRRAEALASAITRDAPSRVLLLSSTGVYRETDGPVDEAAETATTPRARARLLMEALLTAACDECKTPLAILRLPALYGPGRGLHRSLATDRLRLWGGGRQIVSRLHVDDLVAAIHCVLEADPPITGIYNLGDDRPCPLLEVVTWLCERLELALPTEAPLDTAPESLRTGRIVDARAFQDATGWRPRYPSYREGFTQVLQSAAATGGSAPS